MKNQKKSFRILKTVLFCALLLGTVALVSRIVERKASIVRFKPFLDRPDDYDVLFMGDSHVVNGVFPMELWERYGIASYNIASYGNTLPVSYWAMMNALDYAHPKLMVIGIKDVEKSYKLSGNSGDVHTAMDCYPLSFTKIRAIEDLMDDPYAMDDEGHYYTDLKWEYYFTLGKYHSRWSELEKNDFFCELNRKKGGEMAVNVADPREYDIIDENLIAEENGVGFVYLRKMIEECQSRGIEVLLTQLPYPATENEQMYANAVYYIAEEYGVDYIDFVNLDQVVDYEVDCYDSFSHLNPSGARKVTDYLGRYIVDHYDIADHRGEERYKSWEEDDKAYLEEKADYIRGQAKLRNLLMLLHDDAFSVCVFVEKDSPLYQDDKLMTLMQNIAREHIFEEDAFSKWSDSLFPLTRLEDAAAQNEPYFAVIDRKNGAVQEYVGNASFADMETSFGTLSYRAQEKEASLRLAKDGQEAAYFEEDKTGEQTGVRLLVIDAETGEPVAERYF